MVGLNKKKYKMKVRKFSEFVNEEKVNENSNVKRSMKYFQSAVDTVGEEAENMEPGEEQDAVFAALDDIEAAMAVIKDNM